MCEKHNWVEVGAVRCPKLPSPTDPPDYPCGQPKYQCSVCGEYDYGEKGGPGHEACEGCPGPALAI